MYFEVRTATAAAPPATAARPPLLPAVARLCRTASLAVVQNGQRQTASPAVVQNGQRRTASPAVVQNGQRRAATSSVSPARLASAGQAGCRPLSSEWPPLSGNRCCRHAAGTAELRPAGHQTNNKKSRRKTYGFVRVGGGTRTHDIQNHNLTL